MFFPRNDQSNERARQVMDDWDGDSPFWKWIFAAGWVVLVAFLVLWRLGWPGTGLVLVPIGMLLVLGGGIQLLLNRI